MATGGWGETASPPPGGWKSGSPHGLWPGSLMAVGPDRQCDQGPIRLGTPVDGQRDRNPFSHAPRPSTVISCESGVRYVMIPLHNGGRLIRSAPLVPCGRTDAMQKALKLARMLRSHEYGATAVEYAIMAALIAVVIIGAVAAVGNTLNEGYECAASAVGALPGVAECAE